MKSQQQAFPAGYGGDRDGMTLRDWFAAKAMEGMLANGAALGPSDRARLSYEMADAMLKARE